MNDFECDVRDYGEIQTFMSVTLNGLSHPAASHLQISIVSPNGKVFEIVDRQGGTYDYSGT